MKNGYTPPSAPTSLSYSWNLQIQTEPFEIKKDYLKGKENTNNPLHWAIYWSDIFLTNLVFDSYQDQVFMENSEGEVPFDMSFYSRSYLEEQISHYVIFPPLNIF
jgi:hypothetical protein